MNLLGWRLEGGTIKYLGSLTSDVCVFNIFKNLKVKQSEQLLEEDRVFKRLCEDFQ